MIYFRADGNAVICSGHIMRCLSIATQLKKLGEQCVFLIADCTMEDIISKVGFEVIVLNSEWENLDSEIIQMKKIISSNAPKAILIDSYYVTDCYLNAFPKSVRTFYIDDINAFCYPVNCIINYNIYENHFDYSYCQQALLGTQYAPLREEFTMAYQAGFTVNKTVKKVFISTGGADPLNVGTHILAEFTKHEYFSSLDFHIVVGSLNEHKEEILSLAEQYPNIKIYTNITAMAALMQSCDIAISASGSTLYELCACGIPAVNYFFADNQKMIAETFSEQKIMLGAGDLRSDMLGGCEIIVNKCELIFDYSSRIKMSQDMRKITDGEGAKRIAADIKRMIDNV